jgi:hypothetical protein
MWVIYVQALDYPSIGVLLSIHGMKMASLNHFVEENYEAQAW